MKEYRAHFSYYSELYGEFQETIIKVEADNQFEARNKAWDLSENNEDLRFTSNLRLCGVTWNASPLDMQDYFNSLAADEKNHLNCINNVEIPNARIRKDEGLLERCERDRYSDYGRMSSIQAIASDIGKPLQMIPPTHYDEIHYAKEFLTLLEGSYDFHKYGAFADVIRDAENWNPSAMHHIGECFKYGYLSIGEHEYDFSKQFEKDGLYPARADLTDYETPYIRRWENAREYEKLNHLPMFGENDVVAKSDSLPYEWQTLVLKMDALETDYRSPVNAIWIAQNNKAEHTPDEKITVENPITGDISQWNHSDFHGILRPEIDAHIDYDALKREYAAITAAQKDELTNANEWDSEI